MVTKHYPPREQPLSAAVLQKLLAQKPKKKQCRLSITVSRLQYFALHQLAKEGRIPSLSEGIRMAIEMRFPREIATLNELHVYGIDDHV